MELAKINQSEKLNTPKRQWIKAGLILSSLAIIIVAGYFGFTQWQNSQQILSPSIKKQLVFPIFLPTANEPATVNQKTVKYDAANSILSYVVKTATNNNLTVTEQATPESFTVSPQIFTQLIKDLEGYEEFSSQNGTVYLTHPKELKGGQTAVMNSHGTLMFIKPTKKLSDNAWRQLFNNLQIIN